MGRSLLLVGLIAAIVAFVSPAIATGSNPQSTKKKTWSTPPPYPSSICDASDVVPGLIGAKTSLFYGAPLHAAEFLQARIDACAAVIQAWQVAFPTPRPVIDNVPFPAAPGPPPSPCHTNKLNAEVSYLYAMLQGCVAYTKAYVPPLATPTPASLFGSTPPPMPHSAPSQTWHKNIYVMALASDAPTSAQISYRLRDALLKNATLSTAAPDPYLKNVVDSFILVAEPGWTLTNLQAQCFSDPSTTGAIVALQPSQQGNTFNLVLMNTWTVLSWQTVIITCDPTNIAYTGNAAYIRWVTRVESGRANSFSVSLAWALGAMAGVQAFNPTRTTSYAFSSPEPPALPGQSYPTGYSVGVPSSAAGAFAAAGIAALTPVSGTSSPNLLQGNEPDGQVAAAIIKAAPKVASDILAPCDPKGDHNEYGRGTSPQCVWFSKNP
jgi:hypothetical protein